MALEYRLGKKFSPSWTRATFAAALSVRIFGYFWLFHISLTQRAPCSAPLCTSGAWINGPLMECFSCILAHPAEMPRGGTNVPTPKEQAKDECGEFGHFGHRALHLGHHYSMASGDHCDAKKRGPTINSYWVPHRKLRSVSEQSWKNTLQDIFFYAQFPLREITTFWTPITAPLLVCWWTRFSKPIRSRDPVPSSTLRYECWVAPPTP